MAPYGMFVRHGNDAKLSSLRNVEELQQSRRPSDMNSYGSGWF